MVTSHDTYPRGSLVERIARWCIDIAIETAASSDALADRRCQLEHISVRYDVFPDVVEEAVHRARSVPSVFCHGDLWAGHLLVDGDTFTAIDWGDATRHGWAMGDLIHLAISVFGVLDGAKDEAARVEHMRALLLG